LARIRAAELLGDEWLPDVHRAVAKTIASLCVPLHTLTLCHGACGNAVLLLEAARAIGERSWRTAAEDVGRQVVAGHQNGRVFRSGYDLLTREEDPSLLMGNAGIGYYLLQLLCDDVPNILRPQPDGKAKPAMAVSDGSVARTLTAATLPRTLSRLEVEKRQELDAFFSCWRTRREALDLVTRTADDSQTRAELDVELAKLRMRDECPSFALARLQELRIARRTANVESAKDLANCRLRLAPYVRIWQGHSDDGAAKLLRLHGETVVDSELTPFAASLLSQFAVPRTVEEIIPAIAAQAGSAPAAVASAVEQQTLEAVWASILDFDARGEPAGSPRFCS